MAREVGRWAEVLRNKDVILETKLTGSGNYKISIYEGATDEMTEITVPISDRNDFIKRLADSLDAPVKFR